MYKLIKNPLTNVVNYVLHIPTRLQIPFVEGNTYYQEYLKWVAEGNQPLPADE